MSFAQIVGQDRAIRDLRQAFVRGRVPNAYLFVGPQGVGKASCAMILARLLNCDGPRPEPDPCGMCASCRKIQHDNHTDVWVVEPEKSMIKIAQIRQLQRMVRFPPQDANVRVVMIDGVELMNREAANAFLKILEEPPPANLFVLICNSISQLLPTIISRCQRVNFGPVPRQVLSDFLVAAHGVDPVQAHLAAGISEGSVGKALQLDQHLLGPQRRTWLQSLADLHAQPEGKVLALTLAQQLHQASEQSVLYLDQLRIWLRDLLLLREIPASESLLINQDLLPALRRHASLISTEQIHRSVHVIEEVQIALRRNASAQLAFERLFFTLGGGS